MLRAPNQGLENQQVERALQQLNSVLVAGIHILGCQPPALGYRRSTALAVSRVPGDFRYPNPETWKQGKKQG
jgi:hypothetical protein